MRPLVESVTRAIEAPCPGCDARVTITADDPPAILHPMPTCKRYDDIDLNDENCFVDFVRDLRAKVAPETFD